VTRHVKASSAGSIERQGSAGAGSTLRVLFGLLAMLLAAGALGATSASAACPNAVFRTGPSAKLPDCRAYELVTPEYTGGSSPEAVNFSNIFNAFDYPLITSSGDSVIFNTVLGALSGSLGSGLADRYRAKRTANGWTTEFIGPTAEQTTRPVPGGVSPDHEYYFLNAGFGDAPLPEATLQAPFGGFPANYLHKPNGEFELLARGSLGEDRLGEGRLITAGATHVIFTSKTQLESQAPPTGSQAVYDRAPGGPTQVVSVLPAGGEPEGEFTYEGASEDGSDVAFADTLGNGESRLYVRHDNSTTSEVARSNSVQAGVIYAGVFGGQVFYGREVQPTTFHRQEPGDLFSFDIATGVTTQVTNTGDALFSHVSADGSHVYFISESEIGGEGSAGQPNLYVWSRVGSSTKFIATVEPHDVPVPSYEYPAGLAAWTQAVGPEKEKIKGRALSNTRSTPDGSVFLFETTAQLTGFDNTESAPEECGNPFEGGERCTELYRYDTASEALTCVSCPAGPGPATGGASMGGEYEPITELNPPANLSADGSSVFFQSKEDLLPADGNGHQDVYEWKEGSGLTLISTGQSTANSFLYGVTPNGSDVAIWTREPLLPQDQNVGTGRIYDARVNGGFPPPESTVTEPCSGDACQGAPAAAPESPQVASSTLSGSGNLQPKPTCAKGKRRVVSRGSERCVKPRHRKHHKHRRAHVKGRATR
jgi:hypothetical protein